MKKIGVFIVMAAVAVSAMGQYEGSWTWEVADGDTGLTIGGRDFDITQWGPLSNPDSIGVLSDLTITALSLHLWSVNTDRTGGIMYFALYDADQTQLLDSKWVTDGQGWRWSSAFTTVDAHNSAVNYTGSMNLLETNGLELTEGQTYTLQVWAMTYGSPTGDQWYNNQENGGGRYAASFTYNTSTDPEVIPEPATMSLLGLGAMAMVMRRKRRK